MATKRSRPAVSGGREAREAERKKAIQRAAIEVFSRKGYLGCRIADVAREAGVAYGLVYHYFHNKDELLESVFESGWTGFVARVHEAVTHAGTLEQRIRAVVDVAFEAYRRDPRAVKVLILEVGRSPAGGAINRGTAFTGIIELVGGVFRQAQEAGELPAHFDPVLCATMLFGGIETGLTAFVMGLFDRRNEAQLDHARQQVGDMLVRGLVPGAAAPRESTWSPPKSATRSKPASLD